MFIRQISTYLAAQRVITAETQVRNEYPAAKTFTYEVAVKDLNGRLVETFAGGKYTLAPNETRTVTASEKLAGLHFWSWGYGYLYTVITTLKVDGKPVDTVETRTGFRKTEFANGMFKLNDRTIQVHGYAQRTTNEWPAARHRPCRAWMSDFSNRLMVDGNGNLVRWMHVTPWKQDVESCDRVGLMEAMPAGDSEKDVDGPPLGAACRTDARRDHLQPQQPEHYFLRIRQQGRFRSPHGRDEGLPRPI